MKTLHIGLIGDRDDSYPAHRAIPPALELAAASLGEADGGPARVEVTWLPTETLAGVDPDLLTARFSAFQGLWCVPNSPYASEAGALAGIRHARENGVPFLGTCGGFQHSLLGYARDVLGLSGAQHAEIHPGTDFPLLMRMKCSLDGESRISLVPKLQLGNALVRQAPACLRTHPGRSGSFADRRIPKPELGNEGETREKKEGDPSDRA